jgi:DNA-binding response OmpR family regulator
LRALRIVDHLFKPFEISELLDKLQAHVPAHR